MIRIGIIGGGQLARMMIYESRKLGFHFTVLDPAGNPPAAGCADRHIRGGLYDEKSLRTLAESCDISTYDIEHISTEILEKLEGEGNKIEPAPRVLRLIQDKYLQKKLFADAGLPVSPFYPIEGPSDLQAEKIIYPFVQKARTGGYDGRGVAVIREPAELSLLLDCPSIIEEYVPFEKELAVMVARSRTGELRSYPVVEMTFDPITNICDEVIVPANIESKTAALARGIAESAVKALEGVGIFGVELFLTGKHDILVNEVAPRPHNSGHYSIEACYTSQFEQHIRAIAGLPLGNAELLKPAVMGNLLGGGKKGKTAYRGLHKALEMEGCSIHLYGKSESRPNRKMGHVTCIGNDIDLLLERVRRVKDIIDIQGENNG